MHTVSFQLLEDAKATYVITECDDTDACPSCGAGYKVGLSACEFCRVPVGFHRGCDSVPKSGFALLQRGEAVIPAGIEGWGLGRKEGDGYAIGGGFGD